MTVTMPGRNRSLDIAKGIAIMAIVVGHVWRGMNAAGLIGDPKVFSSIDTTIYMWHLSVFAFAAGLFVQRGMARDGSWRYARSRDLEFLWLYILWSLLQGVVKLATASLVNTPTTVWKILRLWMPDTQLWFFGWIALMMVLAAAIRPWVSRSRAIASVVAVTIGSIAVWGTNGSIVGTQGLALTAFFWLALLWRGDRVVAMLSRVSTVVASLTFLTGTVVVIVISLSGTATPPTSGGDGRTVTSVIAGVVASCIGLATVLMLSKVLERMRVGNWLAYIGSKSLVIFVGHIIFTGGTRIGLTVLGLDDVLIQVIVGTAVGVAGPLVAASIADRVHLGWLFAAPRWFSGREMHV